MFDPTSEVRPLPSPLPRPAPSSLADPRLFDRTQSYGHGNNKTGGEKKSILHPDLKTVPRQPQVQVIGNGTIYNYEGLAVRLRCPASLRLPAARFLVLTSRFPLLGHLQEAKLKHPHHKTFHKTVVSDEDEAAGVVRRPFLLRPCSPSLRLRPTPAPLLPAFADALLPLAHRRRPVRPVAAQGDDAVRDRGPQGPGPDAALCVPPPLLFCSASLCRAAADSQSHPAPTARRRRRHRRGDAGPARDDGVRLWRDHV